MSTDHLDKPDHIEAVARAICRASEENPDHSGDCRGNTYRWEDYKGPAVAALETMVSKVSLDDPDKPIPKRPQSQAVLTEQLQNLCVAGDILGLYDASDVVRQTFFYG